DVGVGEGRVGLEVPEGVRETGGQTRELHESLVEQWGTSLARAREPRATKARRPADDLTQIAGVGPRIQELLNEAGIFHFWQLSRLTPEEISELEQRITPRGRILRDKWIEQAERLSRA
ncbi:hypothetical protein ACIKTA_17790, partial [Hansschlegelia beijingensis]